MDELLSLFGADGTEAEGKSNDEHSKAKTEGEPSSHCNDFGSSFDAFAGNLTTTSNRNKRNITNATTTNNSMPSTSRNQSKVNPYPTIKTTAAPKQNYDNGISCDPITGLRIVERKTSRADMVDAFSLLTYRSCSILAASSRAEWNSYLIDGGGSNNGGGKTNLVTCGILTNDTSSRLSSKTGRAFAMLSLGDLPSSMHAKGGSLSLSNSSANNIHASVSVFMFGDALNALRSNTKYMKAGYAVAILGPNLMPPRNGNEKNGGATSVTLSVHDPKQILPIGRAVDCDRCKGSMRIRTTSDYGGTRWDDVRCDTLVDLRLGGYCDKHKRQGLGGGNNKSNNSNRSGNNSNMTFMQKQRAQNTTQISVRGKGDVWVGGQKSLSQGGRPSSLSEALSQSGLLEQQSAPTLAASQLLKRAPLHMKKQPGSFTKHNDNMVASRSAPMNSKVKNPYDKYQQSKPTTKRKDVEDILGEALNRKKMRTVAPCTKNKKSSLISATNSKRPSKVFNTEGYDGAVQVPKPNKLLFQHRNASVHAAAVTPSPVNRSISSASILEKQRSLSAILKGKGKTPASTKQNTMTKESLALSKQKIVASTGGSIKVVRPTNNPSSYQQTNKGNDFASAFGSSNFEADRNDILNAKSRFSSAANAQEYARARAQLQELEAKEATKEGMNSKRKEKEKSTVAIKTTGWSCRTCKKTTPYKPGKFWSFLCCFIVH